MVDQNVINTFLKVKFFYILENKHFDLKNFQIQNNKQTHLTDSLILRELNLISSDNKDKGEIIKQLHFIGWPDHGAPDIDSVYDSFIEMNKQVDEVKSNSNAPVIVHCSAGVGRTGTFMTIYNIHYTLRKQNTNKKISYEFNIWNTVRKLKELRLFSVENIHQYRFIFDFVRKYLKNLS
jgi:protein tyrosine phosphatase